MSLYFLCAFLSGLEFSYDTDFCCPLEIDSFINVVPGRAIHWGNTSQQSSIQQRFRITVEDEAVLVLHSVSYRHGNPGYSRISDSSGQEMSWLSNAGVLPNQLVLQPGDYFLDITNLPGSFVYLSDSYRCDGDYNHNWEIGFDDLLIVINNWGACP